MRILFDQGTPLPLKERFASHQVETARHRGWSQLLNGELLAAADTAGFDLFITTDQNLRSQLDLGRFKIGIFVLMVTNWPMLEPFASQIAEAAERVSAGQYVEWSPP
jgi:hypothetical protein